ncbi:MAG: hypothetical protein ACKVOK_14315 [Flavobacteriales bacterium]
MNPQKFIVWTLFIALIALPVLESCNKYPDGPEFSLRTRKERLSNNWKVDNYSVNDVDLTSLVTGYSEEFSKDGTYAYEWGELNGTGTWDFESNHEQVKLNGSDDQLQRRLFLLKLEETSLWYYYMDGNDRHELHMIAK